MLVLGLDTTSRLGSVALVSDGSLVGTFLGDPSLAQATRLPGDVLTLLAQHELRLADVDVFAVAAGPGSFTGLRIGIAAIQGFAFATGRPAVGVSALEALAHAVRREGLAPGASRVGVWMDAQRDEIFSAVYEDAAAEASGLRIVEGPAVERPAAAAERWRGQQPGILHVAGDGAVRYRGVVEAVMGPAVRVVEPPPIAPSVAMLGAAQARAGHAALPHAVRPLYVRRPDVELARDRAASRAR